MSEGQPTNNTYPFPNTNPAPDTLVYPTPTLPVYPDPFNPLTPYPMYPNPPTPNGFPTVTPVCLPAIPTLDQQRLTKLNVVSELMENRIDIDSRTIYLTTSIDNGGEDGEDGDDFCGWVTAAIRYFDETDGPIKMFISTPGGYTTYMFLLYDLMRSARNPFITIGVGQVESAGVLILAAGHRRLVAENCILMSHEGESDLIGVKTSTAKARMKMITHLEKRWCELMAKHTEKDVAYWTKTNKVNPELWLLGGKEIVEEKIADVIVPAEKGALQIAINEAVDFLYKESK
jgi:ATP-dependent protease ClpP protease subunit